MTATSTHCDLILALDLPDRDAAMRFLDPLIGEIRWVKIGLQLFVAYGPELVKEVAERGFQVFLDLKFHDIPNTVASAVSSLASLPIGLLTLHASGGPEMMQRAAEAARNALPDTRLLAITVLTSMDQASLAACGVDSSPEEQVLRLARLALESNVSGFVASPLELPALRNTFGNNPVIVTPGIRTDSDDRTDDQKRTLNAAKARALGSSFVVVGRPILKAADPVKAARNILAELGHN